MPAKLSTLENALLFRFLGDDRLYTDHDGKRVILDVEGSGTLRLIAADSPVLTIRGGVDDAEFVPNFVNGAIVLAIGPGDVAVQVLKGRSEHLSELPFEVTGDHFGCGWVVGASSRFFVDGKHEPAPNPSSDFPVAFFRSVTGDGTWSIVPEASLICEHVDSFSIGDRPALEARQFTVQNISAISALDSLFHDGTRLSRPVACHLNAATFSVEVPEHNEGLIIRKTYDRFHGRQRARVFVDDAFAGWWYEAGEHRTHRWHQSDFGIGAEWTKGKSRVKLTIDPPAGVALWSVSSYDIYALRAKAS